MGSIRVRRLCLASLMNGMVAGYGVGSVNTPTSKKLPQRSWKEHWHEAEYVARGRSWIGEWWCGSGVENVAVVAGTGLCGVWGGGGVLMVGVWVVCGVSWMGGVFLVMVRAWDRSVRVDQVMRVVVGCDA